MERYQTINRLEGSSLEKKREQIKSAFESYFMFKGYKKIETAAVYPSPDQSVIFVGSTISPLKSYLREGYIPTPGLSIVQPCLRTLKRDYFYNDSEISGYNSYFHQAGILAPANRYESVCEESCNFLTGVLGIDLSRLIVHISSENVNLSRHWLQKNGVQIVKDVHQTGYYEWTYGSNGIMGCGITYSIRLGETSTFRDIGNVIIMYKDGKEIAIEWGFGIETLLSRMLDLPKPQAASKICDIVNFKEGLYEKMLDTLVTSVEMFRMGIEPGRGKASHVLKTYLMGLHYMSQKLGVSKKDIKKMTKAYLLDFENTNITDKILVYLDQIDKKIENYRLWSKQIEDSCRQRKIDPAQSLEKLRTRLGVHPTEINI